MAIVLGLFDAGSLLPVLSLSVSPCSPPPPPPVCFLCASPCLFPRPLLQLTTPPFLAAYKATRIIAEVLVESLPQLCLQSCIYVVVLRKASE